MAHWCVYSGCSARRLCAQAVCGSELCRGGSTIAVHAQIIRGQEYIDQAKIWLQEEGGFAWTF